MVYKLYFEVGKEKVTFEINQFLFVSETLREKIIHFGENIKPDFKGFQIKLGSINCLHLKFEPNFKSEFKMKSME